jgi:hypothetical protein
MTLIDGGRMMRCAYLTNGTMLSGFTLTNGYAGNGGGAMCASSYGVIISNCMIIANAATNHGGGVNQGKLVNCMVTGNSVRGSSASQGGGTYNAYLTNCVIANNSSGYEGGGAYGGNLINCSICGNFSPDRGGGTCNANQTNCINYYNASYSNYTNFYNGSFGYCCTTPQPGGTGNITNEPLLASVSHLSLNSPCRGAGNAAAVSGTDIDGELWANPPSIGCDEIYPGNVSGNISVTITASDTNRAMGYPVNFQANISGSIYASKWDFGDGIVVSNKPYISHSWSSVGDYPVVLTAFNETYPIGQTATVVIHVFLPTVFYVAVSNNAPVAPYDSWVKAATNIQNAIDVANPGNLVLVSNGVYRIGSRTNSDGIMSRGLVTNSLTLQSVNGPAVTLIDGGQTVRCVYLTNGSVLAGFTLTNGNAGNGAGVRCASTNVLLYNCLLVGNSGYGVYSGTLSNCILAQNSLDGANSSILNNCTITNNSGYGASYSTLNNCLVSKNASYGASFSTLNNCLVSSNANSGIDQGMATGCIFIGNSGSYGGGARYSTLTNCLLLANKASQNGGGAYACSLKNCIVYYNTAQSAGSNYYYSDLYFCCAMPLPTTSSVNITNTPLFVNIAGGDFHLQSNSPCINSGNNSYVSTTSDLDSNPRIVGGTVDIGPYEFQSPASTISYAWLQKYNLPITTNTDYGDTDNDGMNNWQEWRTGTNPTNDLSLLEMLTASSTNNPSGVIVTWQSVTNRTYFLQRGTNLSSQSIFSTIQSNIPGQTGTAS